MISRRKAITGAGAVTAAAAVGVVPGMSCDFVSCAPIDAPFEFDVSELLVKGHERYSYVASLLTEAEKQNLPPDIGGVPLIAGWDFMD